MPPVGRNDLSLPSEPNTAQTDAANSVGSIAIDVEEFAKTWMHRANRLVHRAARLVERESLLAGAIGRLNQQKEEWKRRTEAKDNELREQSELLTEAWLEVEAERRKAIQGARIAQHGNNRSNPGPILTSQNQTAPVIATPVQAVPAGPALASPVAPPPVLGDQPIAGGAVPGSNSVRAANEGAAPVDAGQNRLPLAPAARPVISQPPAGMAPPMQPQIPINATSATPGATNESASGSRASDPDALAAETKERLEEFKRMQRAIRANRNT